MNNDLATSGWQSGRELAMMPTQIQSYRMLQPLPAWSAIVFKSKEYLKRNNKYNRSHSPNKQWIRWHEESSKHLPLMLFLVNWLWNLSHFAVRQTAIYKISYWIKSQLKIFNCNRVIFHFTAPLLCPRHRSYWSPCAVLRTLCLHVYPLNFGDINCK